MNRVFVDTNIIIDVYEKREGYESSRIVLSLIYDGIIRGYISQGSLYTILYLLEETLGKQEARAQAMGLTMFLRVVACSSGESFRGLQTQFTDAEDALQHATAMSAGAQAIITRNGKDYKHSTLPVFTPEQFIAQA